MEELVLSVVTLLGVLLSAYVSKKSLNLNKKALGQEENLARKDIDGNIIAKARIQWIQEVRKETSLVFTELERFTVLTNNPLLYNIKNKEKNEKIIDGASQKILFQLNILLLFFGDDSIESDIRKNKGKNKEIITEINELKEKVKISYVNYIETINIKERMKNNYRAITDLEANEQLTEIIGDEEAEQYIAAREQYEKYREKLDTIEISYKENNKKLVEMTNNFSNMLRMYLKNEWKEITEVRK